MNKGMNLKKGRHEHMKVMCVRSFLKIRIATRPKQFNSILHGRLSGGDGRLSGGLLSIGFYRHSFNFFSGGFSFLTGLNLGEGFIKKEKQRIRNEFIKRSLKNTIY